MVAGLALTRIDELPNPEVKITIDKKVLRVEITVLCIFLWSYMCVNIGFCKSVFFYFFYFIILFLITQVFGGFSLNQKVLGGKLV